MRSRLSVRGALFAEVTLRRLRIIPDILLLGRSTPPLLKGAGGISDEGMKASFALMPLALTTSAASGA